MNASIVSTILRALLKWWWLIIVTTALSVGVGYFVRTEQPDIFASRATLLVGQDIRTVSGTFGTNRDLVAAYSVFVRRPTVLQPVIDDLSLEIEPDDLNAIMAVEVNATASLIEITIYDTDPERAAVIANRIGQEMVNQSSQGHGSSVADRDFVQREMANLQRQIDQLQGRYDELLAEMVTLNSAFEINQNLRESETIYDTLQNMRTLYSSYLSSSGQIQGQIQLFEPAMPNYRPVVTNNIFDLVVAGGIGLLLSVATITMISFLDDRFQWAESDTETVQGLRVLGPLGIVPSSNMPLYAETAPESLEAEALRQVRSKITLAASPEAAARVLTFVSNDSGDGKTITTTNMALTYARSGERTIVIDGDIRKGDMHELFQLPNISGISEVLASKEPLPKLLSKTILDTGYDNLAFLPAGRLANDPAALLSSPRMKELVETLKNAYDIVIFDSAPTIAGQDSVFLGELSDGVVIVVNARRTTQTALKRTIQHLKEGHGLTIFGIVVNRVRLQITSKYNSSYYRHTGGINPEQLNRELITPKQGGLTLRANITTNKNGEHLYSLKAAATRLGIREKVLKDWIKTGQIKAERKSLRQWINEKEIERLLQRLPTADMSFAPAALAEAKINGMHTGRLPDLSGNRDAVLDFATRPTKPESDED